MSAAKRNRSGKRDIGRDAGGFMALPWSVVDSPAYQDLSAHAKALLIEVARQYHRGDNGRMLLSDAYLSTRGWLSASVIHRAKNELLAAGLIFRTVQGHRPNKASWYACTWRDLDKLQGYDAGTEQAFERSAYHRIPPKGKRPQPACRNPKKNASLTPPCGVENATIAPPHGVENVPTTPPRGAIRGVFYTPLTPPHGDPLELTICRARSSQPPPAAGETAAPAGSNRPGEGKPLPSRISNIERRAGNWALLHSLAETCKQELAP